MWTHHGLLSKHVVPRICQRFAKTLAVTVLISHVGVRANFLDKLPCAANKYLPNDVVH